MYVIMSQIKENLEYVSTEVFEQLNILFPPLTSSAKESQSKEYF